MKIKLKDVETILDKDRALYLIAYKMLVISDLHLGKSAHFRKGGLQIPSTITHADLDRLDNLLIKYKPEILLITGDMFHHSLNKDIEDFSVLRKKHAAIKFILVKGNHDRLAKENYLGFNIEVYDSCYSIGPFCFIHNLPEDFEDKLYPITGHIHPGITLKGKAKQRLKFPCFYFGKKHAILPAFSLFTGLSIIKPNVDEKVYAITASDVVEL
jgi:DNA ligase-associated metallophosphoesterase